MINVKRINRLWMKTVELVKGEDDFFVSKPPLILINNVKEVDGLRPEVVSSRRVMGNFFS